MTPIFSLPVLFQDNTVLLLFCTVPTNWEILWLFPVLINPFNIFSEYILSHTLLMKLRAQKQNLICFARFKLNSSGTPVPQSLRGLPHCSARKEPTCQCRRGKRQGFHPWVGKIPWREKWQSTPVFLPGKSHERRNLAGYSPWDCRVRHDWACTKRQTI